MREDRDTWFDFEAMARNEKDDDPTPWDQESRPHLFVRKLRRRPGGLQTITPGNARAHDLTVEEFTSIHAAAEFAARSGMPLDMHTTLDFAKLGVFDPGEVKAALSRFVRCYSAWCSERHLPSGWISCIEMSKSLTYHAHVVLFVPGYYGLQMGPPKDTLRLEFRRWVRGYAKRNYGVDDPSALRVRGGRTESWMTHWILTTYLMKGFDRKAVLCSARNSPDGMCIQLGDVIPWHYCDPGPVALNRRIGVCENLGRSRRLFGSPKGFESNLPRKPDLTQSLFDRPKLTELEEFLRPKTVVLPTPFRSALEDGVRDVRKLYPQDFYEFVTRLSLSQTFDPEEVVCDFDEGADFLEQLRKLDS